VSCTPFVPTTVTQGSMTPGDSTVTFTPRATVYTTGGQVVGDNAGGAGFVVTPFTWNTGGGG